MLSLLLISAGLISVVRADQPPNIVWIIVDDMSPNLSCYGEELIQTPSVDAIARRGVRFSKAFVTAPVCSTCRSALITGCYQTTIGAHHHRSGRGVHKIQLPPGMDPIPALFQRAVYFTSIGGPLVEGTDRLGKTDYNFDWNPSIYNGNDWRNRKPNQPFFAQIQLHGGKYRGQGPRHEWNRQALPILGSKVNPKSVTLAPYYPRDPVILEDWANYLDAVRFTDRQVGEIVERLQAEGILDQTIIFFMTDHGISHARGKQFCYDEGLHVPLIVAGPGIPTGVVRNDLVEHIDLAATSLALAKIPIPTTMQGRDLLAPTYQPREHTFAARDRCDETVDHIRSVRSTEWKYIRNYLPERPHLQPNMYKDGKEIIQRLRELQAAGRLTPLQERLLFAPTRPTEELYRLSVDPFETVNLANEPAWKDQLERMRLALLQWERDTNDLGRTPESPLMYNSDMAVYQAERTGRRGSKQKKEN